MFPAARLKALQQRKQDLLCASEVHRRLSALECSAVEQRLKWADSVVSVAHRVTPFLGIVVPLFRTLSAQRNGEQSWFARITDLLPVAPRIAGAAQQCIQRQIASDT